VLVFGIDSAAVRAVVQRVSEARVSGDGESLGAVGPGLCVLLGVAQSDTEAVASKLASRLAKLRIFPDEEGRFDRSVVDVGGAVLLVSQFTLIADTSAGNRPSFSAAARPEQAEPLYEQVATELRGLGVPVETGRFGAHMEVALVNDGPVTIVLDVA
jgi:D-aminoacyl-tRNA deacylase